MIIGEFDKWCLPGKYAMLSWNAGKKTYTQANISRMVESTDVPMQDPVQKKHTNHKEK